MPQASFIRSNTAESAVPLLPELRLHLAREITPVWEATETAAAGECPPPYWAFAWAGGVALARHLLDHPHLVAGRRVVDFAAGSGVVAIAAARAGAASVLALEIDSLAAAVIPLNATLNGVTVAVSCQDVVGQPLSHCDVLCAGDVCYERPMAERLFPWLQAESRRGLLVLMGDPGRNYLPSHGLERLGFYRVPTSLELESREQRDTTVWRVLAAAAEGDGAQDGTRTGA